MSWRTWKLIAGYALLAVAVLVCLHFASLAPLWLSWGRELLAAAIAITAVLVGLRFAHIAAPATMQQPDPGPGSPSPIVSSSPLLSVRELEVLHLLADGLSNKEMARALTVSENTVKTHLANIYGKLEVGRRTEALAVARRRGLING